MTKIPNCDVAVILYPTVSNVCVFQALVFGEMKLFVVLGFLVCPFSNLNLTYI